MKKASVGGIGRSLPSPWTAAEVRQLLACLCSDDFMRAHSPSIPAGVFPELTVRMACEKGSEAHSLCVALAREIQTKMGEHNNHNLRPFASIASKLGDMRTRAGCSSEGANQKKCFKSFDVDDFMAWAAKKSAAGGVPTAAAVAAAAAAAAAVAASRRLATSFDAPQEPPPPDQQQRTSRGSSEAGSASSSARPREAPPPQPAAVDGPASIPRSVSVSSPPARRAPAGTAEDPIEVAEDPIELASLVRTREEAAPEQEGEQEGGEEGEDSESVLTEEELHEQGGGGDAAADSSSRDADRAARGAARAPPPPAGAAAAAPRPWPTPVRDGCELHFHPKILNPHLVCALCEGYFRDASTILECLHTFCKACIERHFDEEEEDECPVCLCDLGPNPLELVRADRTLQSIVDKVFPHFEAAASARAPKRKASASAGKPKGGGAIRAPEGVERAERAVKAVRVSAAGGVSGGAASDKTLLQSLLSMHLEDTSGETLPLDKPFLRSPSLLTICHLQNHLSRKVHLQNGSLAAFDGGGKRARFEISCCGKILEPELTLDAVSRVYSGGSDLTLHYRVVYSLDGPDDDGSGAGGYGDTTLSCSPWPG